MSVETRLFEKGHTDIKKGAKNVIDILGSRIADDIDKYIDPDFENKKKTEEE